jgi:hypothetical protein
MTLATISECETGGGGREVPEGGVFLAILGGVNQLRSLVSDYEAGKITRTSLSRKGSGIIGDLCKIAEDTQRFDVVCPVVEYGVFSDSFWRWFNWWNDYAITLTTRRRLDGMLKRRPPGDWAKHRKTPAFEPYIT